MTDEVHEIMTKRDDEIRAALEQAFRALFDVVSIADLKNPPVRAEFDRNKDLKAALDRLAAVLSRDSG